MPPGWKLYDCGRSAISVVLIGLRSNSPNCRGWLCSTRWQGRTLRFWWTQSTHRLQLGRFFAWVRTSWQVSLPKRLHLMVGDLPRLYALAFQFTRGLVNVG